MTRAAAGAGIGVTWIPPEGGCRFYVVKSGRNPIIGIQGAVPIDPDPTAAGAGPGIVPDGSGAEPVSDSSGPRTLPGSDKGEERHRGHN